LPEQVVELEALVLRYRAPNLQDIEKHEACTKLKQKYNARQLESLANFTGELFDFRTFEGFDSWDVYETLHAFDLDEILEHVEDRVRFEDVEKLRALSSMLTENFEAFFSLEVQKELAASELQEHYTHTELKMLKNMRRKVKELLASHIGSDQHKPCDQKH
jgi:hypothetical protein